jgi:hypothetical protein
MVKIFRPRYDPLPDTQIDNSTLRNATINKRARIKGNNGSIFYVGVYESITTEPRYNGNRGGRIQDLDPLKYGFNGPTSPDAMKLYENGSAYSEEFNLLEELNFNLYIPYHPDTKEILIYDSFHKENDKKDISEYSKVKADVDGKIEDIIKKDIDFSEKTNGKKNYFLITTVIIVLILVIITGIVLIAKRKSLKKKKSK